MSLKEDFLDFYQRHGADGPAYWLAVENAHATRPYHNMAHLEQVYQALLPYKVEMPWDATVLAIAYHDFVLETRRRNNERMSEKYLRSTHVLRYAFKQNGGAVWFPDDVIGLASEMILNTELHGWHHVRHVNLFCDADMSVLGSNGLVYGQYVNAVREEYGHVPIAEFLAGRKAFLTRTLDGPIFKTHDFTAEYESRAEYNMFNEIAAIDQCDPEKLYARVFGSKYKTQ